MGQSPGMIETLEAGLRATDLRQKVIANNIANMATPGYRRREAAFEKVLSTAIENNDPVSPETLAEAIRQPGTGPLNEYGNDVDLDQEVGDLVQNSLKYKTYMRMLKRTYTQMELAIRSD